MVTRYALGSGRLGFLGLNGRDHSPVIVVDSASFIDLFSLEASALDGPANTRFGERVVIWEAVQSFSRVVLSGSSSRVGRTSVSGAGSVVLSGSSSRVDRTSVSGAGSVRIKITQ